MSIHEKFLKGLLSKRLRIKIIDGRIIDGTLTCTDDGCNLVISNCEEFLTQSDVDEKEANQQSKNPNVRTLTMAIVPGEQIASIAVTGGPLPEDVLKYLQDECVENERSVD